MHGEMNATVHTLPNLPPGAVIRVGTLTVGLHGMFPLVTSMPALSSGTRLSMHIVVDFQAQGQAGELEMTAEDQRDETYTPL